MDFLKDKDSIVISSFDVTVKDTFGYFSSTISQSMVNVDVTVYDTVSDSVVNTYTLSFVDFNNPKFTTINPVSSLDHTGSISINTSNLLDVLGYVRGKYKVIYKFYINILGNNENKLYIRKISSSRKEIIIDTIDKSLLSNYNTFTDVYFERYTQIFTFDKFINLGVKDNILIVNSKNQNESTGNSLILKLYEPLPNKFSVKDVLHISQLISHEIEDIVSIDFMINIDPYSNANILRPANKNIGYENNNLDYTKYKSYYDLIDTSSLGDKYFSTFNNTSSAEGINLDIDYSYLSNFVHYGSATQMIYNFRNKLLSIENIDSKMTSSMSMSMASSSSLYYKNKKYNIIGSFTPYERFLYFQTSSYFTSSLYLDQYGTASYIDATYPKSGSDITNYVLYSVSSSISQEWFATMSQIAFDYDYSNVNSLIKTVPEYIINDTLSNETYINFINMIGEFYDNIWLYVVSLQRKLKRENKFKDGVPGELIWNVLKNSGLNINNGQNLVDLTKYKYSYINTSNSYTALERSEQIVTHEIWNRILNNYPYILKSKGTEKSIRALFNCYGIPNSLIQLYEFGGPIITSSIDNKTRRKYETTYQDFTFVINMTGSQSICVPWTNTSYDSMKPDSIEFKIRPDRYSGNMDIFSLTGSNGEIKLSLLKTYGEFGKFVLQFDSASSVISVSSSIKSYYNNEFYSILVKRSEQIDNPTVSQNYYVKIQNHDDYINKIILDETIILNVTESGFNRTYINADKFYLGGNINSITKFVGSMDEFRLWAEPLDNDTFDFHTKYSSATNGNSLTSSLSALAFRLSFNTVYDLNATSSMLNDAFDTTYAESASLIGFTSTSGFPYNFSDFERSNTIEHPLVGSDIYNKKIRIERNNIEYVTTGSIQVRPLRGNYIINGLSPIGDVGEFNNYIQESDTLLIGFSPVDFVNRDIIAFYGNNDILSVYGDFDNIYQSKYPSNNFIIDTYWNNTKTEVSFTEYIKYIKTYNRSLFDTLYNFIPAKTSLIMGTVYDQNILRRNKIKLMSEEKATIYEKKLVVIDQRKYIPVESIIANDNTECTTLKYTDKIFSIPSELDNIDTGVIESVIFNMQSYDEMQSAIITYDLNPYNLLAYNDMSLNKQRKVSQNDIFHKGTKNSSLTTPDRKPAVEIKSSNAKKLIVNYADTPKLIVS